MLTVGSFLLTVELFYLQSTISAFFAYSWSFFAYSLSLFAYNSSFFAYNGKVRPIRALRDCKQRSLTVGRKAPTVSKKASPVLNGFFGQCPEMGPKWVRKWGWTACSGCRTEEVGKRSAITFCVFGHFWVTFSGRFAGSSGQELWPD